MRFKNSGTVSGGVVEQTEIKNRMSLDLIKKSHPVGGEKTVLYGPEGWGKSTFGAQAQSPVFISTEDGLKNIEANKFPDPQDWGDIFSAVNALRSSDHEYKTLVIDTVDWANHFCQKHLCEAGGKKSISEFSHGSGYVLMFEEWKKLLSKIDAMRREKNMDVILLAHSQINTFTNPVGVDFMRYEMKVDKRVSALIREWADSVLFATYDIAVNEEKNSNKGKAFGGERMILANHSPSWDAKNRYGILNPIVVPADKNKLFETYWNHVKGEKNNG